jgi:osmotically-inducible protein OsmY
LAQAPSAPGNQEIPREIVVTAVRNADAALTAKVETALKENTYIFADHVTVTTEGGVVHLHGMVTDLDDLFAILRMAHRIAGSGRVVNEIEFAPIDFDGD